MLKEKTEIASIDKKLSIIISILLAIANDGKKISLKDRISNLASFGLSSAEIADILGKKVGHISKELSQSKK